MARDKKRFNDYQRVWHKKRYDKRRAEYLEGKTCAQCDSTKKLYLTNMGKNVPSSFWSYSEKKFQEYLKGVVLLCHRHFCENRSKIRGHALPKWTDKARLKRRRQRLQIIRKKKKIEVAKVALKALGFELK